MNNKEVELKQIKKVKTMNMGSLENDQHLKFKIKIKYTKNTL